MTFTCFRGIKKNVLANSSAPLLEICDVSVVRGSTVILDRLSMTVPQGRHTAVLGPNGSGKSSLLKIFQREFYPSIDESGRQGDLRILGESLFDARELWRRMGIVTAGLDHEFQIGQAAKMNVVDAIASGLTASRIKQFGPAITDSVRQSISLVADQMHVNHLLDRSVATLNRCFIVSVRRIPEITWAVLTNEYLILNNTQSGFASLT